MTSISIVEDTPAEAQLLLAHLQQYELQHHQHFLITCFATAQEYMHSRTYADLIFMDIDLPGMSGMEAARILRKHQQQTPLIFITNLAQYAVRGYEVDAIDFMVKPVSYDNFEIRMDRALRIIYRVGNRAITLITDNGVRVVNMKELVYVDILRHDVHYHLSDGTIYKRRGTIKATLQELQDESFVKISASCIINMAQVQTIQPDHVVMNTGEILWFSRLQKNQALVALNNYLAQG